MSTTAATTGETRRPPTSFEEMTSADAARMEAAYGDDYVGERVDQILSLLRTLDKDDATSAIGMANLFAHSLQGATRALRDGKDEEYVVMLLLHDIFDELDGDRHSEIAAELLRPHLSDENLWILKHHGEFQNVHKGWVTAEERTSAERHRGHPAFDATVEFCAKYDQRSFDAAYVSMELEEFRPMVVRVLSHTYDR